MFFAPEIFFGCVPKILDGHYKIRPSTDHRAKFHAGRPTHLGDLMLGKKLEIWGKDQRESARRPKFDWRGRVKFHGIKVTWPEPKFIGIRRTRIVDLG